MDTNSRSILPERAEPKKKVSLGSIVTGLVVVIGAMLLLDVFIMLVMTTAGYPIADALAGDVPDQVALGIGVAMLIAGFLAFLWGGYTAGRMSARAGALHGTLVPILALLLGGLVWAAAVFAGAPQQLGLPFTPETFSVALRDDVLIYAAGFALASVVVSFAGAIAGGIAGVRWHILQTQFGPSPGTQRIDLRDKTTARPSRPAQV